MAPSEGGAVIIVDADSAQAAAVAAAVRAQGHAVTVATTAAEALGCLERDAPHVLVLALPLPDMDGLDVARRAGLLPAPPAVDWGIRTG